MSLSAHFSWSVHKTSIFSKCVDVPQAKYKTREIRASVTARCIEGLLSLALTEQGAGKGAVFLSDVSFSHFGGEKK